jgi:hypothetical protein
MVENKDNSVLIVYPASVVNWIYQFLNSEIFVDPIPHIGKLDQNGEIRKGLKGQGLVVEGEWRMPEEIKPGQTVVFRREQ